MVARDNSFVSVIDDEREVRQGGVAREVPTALFELIYGAGDVCVVFPCDGGRD